MYIQKLCFFMLSQSQSQWNINMYNEFNFVCVTSMMTGEVHHVLSMSITVCWNFLQTRGTYTHMKWRGENTGEWWCEWCGWYIIKYVCAITFVTRLNGRDNNFDFGLTFSFLHSLKSLLSISCQSYRWIFRYLIAITNGWKPNISSG